MTEAGCLYTPTGTYGMSNLRKKDEERSDTGGWSRRQRETAKPLQTLTQKRRRLPTTCPERWTSIGEQR